MGTAPKKYGSVRMIYLMQVERAFTFREYSDQQQLRILRRNDNIYQPLSDGGYTQRKNIWHGSEGIHKDLSADRVLYSEKFVYFGRNAPEIPTEYTGFIPKGQGHLVFGSRSGKQADPAMERKIKRLVRWAFAQRKAEMGRPFDELSSYHTC